jgi:hypothetical protein
MVRILAVSFFLSFIVPTSAATIDINLFPNGVFQGSAITVNNGLGTFGIGGGYLTSFYAANPGDIVNFGTANFPAFTTGNQYGYVSLVTGYASPFYTPFPNNGSMPTAPLNFIFSCNAILNSSCLPLINGGLASYVPHETSLSFGVPDGASGIQLVFNTTVFDYIAPAVPEPSTWAMMILGFAGVGFMTYRRRNQSTALTVA